MSNQTYRLVRHHSYYHNRPEGFDVTMEIILYKLQFLPLYSMDEIGSCIQPKLKIWIFYTFVRNSTSFSFVLLHSTWEKAHTLGRYH
jgi:hypothetical protein